MKVKVMTIADTILQTTCIKNYKRYINNMFINREIDLNVKKVCKKVVNDNKVVKKDDVNIFGEKICFYPLCLNKVSGNNYCHLHHKDMI